MMARVSHYNTRVQLRSEVRQELFEANHVLRALAARLGVVIAAATHGHVLVCTADQLHLSLGSESLGERCGGLAFLYMVTTISIGGH